METNNKQWHPMLNFMNATLSPFEMTNGMEFVADGPDAGIKHTGCVGFGDKFLDAKGREIGLSFSARKVEPIVDEGIIISTLWEITMQEYREGATWGKPVVWQSYGGKEDLLSEIRVAYKNAACNAYHWCEAKRYGLKVTRSSIVYSNIIK